VSEHDQYRELVEAYALGALDAQERADFEAHLATGCAECAAALAEARYLTAQLAHLAPDAEPSDMLRGRLLQTVRAEARSTATATVSTKSTIPYWLWAGIAALLLLTAYSTWDDRRLQREIQAVNDQAATESRQREHLQRELSAMTHENKILTDPASRKVMLMPHDTKMPQMEAMWHPQMGICLIGQKIPSPNSGRVLQLWLIPKKVGGKPMPVRTFMPDANGNIIAMTEHPPDIMADVKALAITDEPAGGSPQPTSTPMWVGGIS
jgi:anti-sigma-K factor RskA